MREVELPLTHESLADALGQFRKWLDEFGCVPVAFEIARQDGARLVIRAVFKDEAMADAFQWTFDRSKDP